MKLPCHAGLPRHRAASDAKKAVVVADVCSKTRSRKRVIDFKNRPSASSAGCDKHSRATSPKSKVASPVAPFQWAERFQARPLKADRIDPDRTMSAAGLGRQTSRRTGNVHVKAKP